jgi:chromosome segregation ATPase
LTEVILPGPASSPTPSQLRDNGQLSRLCAEQESRLGELERQQEGLSQETEDRRRMLEDVQSDKATISRALTQNRTLKDQLAELQNGFVKLVSPRDRCLHTQYRH